MEGFELIHIGSFQSRTPSLDHPQLRISKTAINLTRAGFVSTEIELICNGPNHISSRMSIQAEHLTRAM